MTDHVVLARLIDFGVIRVEEALLVIDQQQVNLHGGTTYPAVCWEGCLGKVFTAPVSSNPS
jgi:hypothetical protein